MFWFDELKALVGDVVADTVVIGAGAITTALVPKMIENEKLRIVPQVAGLGIMAYGGYDLYKTLKGTQPEWIGDNESVTVTISGPRSGDKWHKLVPHEFKTTFYNPYDSPKRIWAFYYLEHESGGVFYRCGEKIMSLGAREEEHHSVWVTPSLDWWDGNYHAVVVVHNQLGEGEAPTHHGRNTVYPVYIGF